MKTSIFIHTIKAVLAGCLLITPNAMAQEIHPTTAVRPGTDGNLYVPYDARTGNESIVYFTRRPIRISIRGLRAGQRTHRGTAPA